MFLEQGIFCIDNPDHCYKCVLTLHRDEEYDRGKRKKVRNSKHDFSGPNRFQEIASQKIAKKSKFDQDFAGNRPLRI